MPVSALCVEMETFCTKLIQMKGRLRGREKIEIHLLSNHIRLIYALLAPCQEFRSSAHYFIRNGNPVKQKPSRSLFILQGVLNSNLKIQFWEPHPIQ